MNAPGAQHADGRSGTRPSGTPLVTCVDVGVRYGTGERAVVAVHDVTCTVTAADRIAVTGPSGSGKSTLLHLMAGLETPTAGRVSWPALSGGRIAQQIGLVFQAPTLIPSLSVVENVALPLVLSDAPADEAGPRARTALSLLGLDDLRDALPQELSGGQAQRVVLARVLASAPRLILADEPTSQLDRATADHVIDVLLQVCGELDAALVVATHDPAVSSRLDETWPIRDGRLQQAAAGGPS